MKISEILQWTDADVVGILDPDSAPTGVATDSRTVGAGELFVALCGDRFDGHDYVEAAFASGACAAVVARDWEGLQSHTAGPLLVVDSPLRAYGAIANGYRRRFDIPVIGVVGSAGKTTT
ncbi:MAG: Mur ligase domain-containing protein, partial [Candidatus Latescibacteria bacterium]|nr:Mur ligase domain-containing protein [Candidatus Latescibacterota bacterium]